MNRRLPPARDAERFVFHYNGEPIEALPGDTIASALLAAGVDIFSRSIKYHRPRGPSCLSGRCSGCLVRVDGHHDVVACITPASPEVAVSPQNAYPSAKHDVLAAIDWMFPKGLDHHSMFAGVPLVDRAAAKVARHIAGLAPVPTRPSPAGAPSERRRCDVAVVGAGPAGLACAQALSAAGLAVEVIEERPEVGGRLLAGLEGAPELDLDWARATRRACEAAGIRFHLSATVLAVYRDEGRTTLAVRLSEPERLLLLEAGQLALCNGSYEPLEPFEDNDLPGIFAGRGLARLVQRQRVLPGKAAVVVGRGAEALALARLLSNGGAKVEALVETTGSLATGEFRLLSGFRPVAAEGRRHVQALRLADGAGHTDRVECDLVALCPVPAPAIDLPLQAGVGVGYRGESGGYFVRADRQGRTDADGIWAAGDVTGATDAQAAKRAGEALGQALAAAGRSAR